METGLVGKLLLPHKHLLEPLQKDHPNSYPRKVLLRARGLRWSRTMGENDRAAEPRSLAESDGAKSTLETAAASRRRRSNLPVSIHHLRMVSQGQDQGNIKTHGLDLGILRFIE